MLGYASEAVNRDTRPIRRALGALECDEPENADPRRAEAIRALTTERSQWIKHRTHRVAATIDMVRSVAILWVSPPRSPGARVASSASTPRPLVK